MVKGPNVSCFWQQIPPTMKNRCFIDPVDQICGALDSSVPMSYVDFKKSQQSFLLLFPAVNYKKCQWPMSPCEPMSLSPRSVSYCQILKIAIFKGHVHFNYLINSSSVLQIPPGWPSPGVLLHSPSRSLHYVTLSAPNTQTFCLCLNDFDPQCSTLMHLLH